MQKHDQEAFGQTTNESRHSLRMKAIAARGGSIAAKAASGGLIAATYMEFASRSPVTASFLAAAALGAGAVDDILAKRSDNLCQQIEPAAVDPVFQKME
jgi:hypothetical protein